MGVWGERCRGLGGRWLRWRRASIVRGLGSEASGRLGECHGSGRDH